MSVLLDLNRQNDVALILDQANGDSFPITFGILSESPQNPMRVGLATRDECGCTIQLSEKIFNPSKQLFKSVTFHELGHCAGLNHSSQTGDIMFPVAYPFHSYTAPAFDKFLDDLSMIAGVR
ncbi:MAG: matrixin family metalloprotease [Deltaproteobacteria bacterium]|nr:matrixin family metalloprotease [Deltaproteobacteria bacterium]